MGQVSSTTCKTTRITIFGEDATSALAGLSWSNWNLEMLVFEEGGKLENPEKNLRNKARTNNKLNPHITPGQNRTWATLVGSEHSHHALKELANKIPKKNLKGNSDGIKIGL